MKSWAKMLNINKWNCLKNACWMVVGEGCVGRIWLLNVDTESAGSTGWKDVTLVLRDDTREPVHLSAQVTSFHFETFHELSWGHHPEQTASKLYLFIVFYFNVRTSNYRGLLVLSLGKHSSVHKQSWLFAKLPCVMRGLWAAIQALVLGCQATSHWG